MPIVSIPQSYCQERHRDSQRGKSKDNRSIAKSKAEKTTIEKVKGGCMKYLAFDIETIPQPDLPEGVKPEFDPESVKLGNVKDPEKIKVKLEEAEQQFESDLIKKMSLDPDLCEVVAFACFPEGEKVDFYADDNEHDEDTEYEIIHEAWDQIRTAYNTRIPIVSYNGIGFDLPVLFHAAIRLDIPLSPTMYLDLTRKYDNKVHYDLMQILAGWDRTKWKPLDFYLKLFGVGGKSESGSQVYEMWKAKEYEKIREYCKQDVLMTAKLFDRIFPWIIKEG